MRLLLLSSVSVYAQEPVCKSKGELRVVYPEIARRMKIAGVVRLRLELTSSGSVREGKVLRRQSRAGICRTGSRQAG